MFLPLVSIDNLSPAIASFHILKLANHALWAPFLFFFWDRPFLVQGHFFSTLGVYMYIWYIHFFVYIIYTKKCIYIYYIYSYIYSIYTLYMKFGNGLYICIYTLYMRFWDLVYIQYIYNVKRCKSYMFQYCLVKIPSNQYWFPNLYIWYIQLLYI